MGARGDWKTTVEEALKNVDASSLGTEENRGQDFTICLTGDYSPDSVFMVAVPVKFRPRETL